MKDILHSAPLFYPSAKEWMWDYCIYLGPFTDSKGMNFDLGIFIAHTDDISAAIVYGNEPGNYISGNFKHIDINNSKMEHYIETYNRAKCLNLL
jgi:hypothetical protein